MIPLLIALLIAPAEAGPGRRRRGDDVSEPPVRPEVTAVVEVQAAQVPGSLWGGSTSMAMYGLNSNSRQVGDLVTVRIREYTATALDAGTTSNRGSSAEYGVGGALGIEQGILANNPGMGGGLNVGGSSSSTFTGNGTTSRGGTVDTDVTCEIIEVKPNGVIRLWGFKEIRVNRETQYVSFDGEARSQDVTVDNTIESARFALAHIEITGGGVVADKQGPGFVVRLLDALWPF
jgi:flagellar L-ring protein precursor FlgH